MLLGFNTNYRYRGVLFHVQTEDSGVSNPHVITHLFHGGNILASVKVDYSAKLEQGDFESEVRRLMETQHKSMLKSLQAGDRDAIIFERVGPGTFSDITDTASPLVTELEEAGTESASLSEPVTEAQLVEPASAWADAQPVQLSDPTPTPALPPTPLPSTAVIEATPDAEETPKDRLSRAFGDSVVSEKPLDEVVLEYLVENARKRKRRPQ